MGQTDPFELIRKRLRNSTGKPRSHGTDYLLYCLLDLVIDEGFPVLENLSEQIEQLEEELLSDPSKNTLRQLHEIKRELLLLRHIFWPQRELVNKLIRDESDCTLPARLLRPYRANYGFAGNLSRYDCQHAGCLSIQRQLPIKRCDASIDGHCHYFHSIDLYRGRLRYEFQCPFRQPLGDARIGLVLQLSCALVNDDCSGWRNDFIFQT